MLIIGDLSGIQDYLFDVRESGGKQAASLRSRSFRLQVIAECLARRFLWACGLDEDRLLFVAAGKFAIDADGVADAGALTSQAHADSQRWLFEHAHGRLRFAFGTEPPGLPVVDRYATAMRALQRSKLSAWRPADKHAMNWAATRLSSTRPWDPKSEAERDANEGREVLKAEVVTLAPAPDRPAGSGHDGRDIAGVAQAWGTRAAAPPGGAMRVTIDLRRLSRHIPREADGAPVEFVRLGAKSRGASMLGVLKADADSLGAAIRGELTGAADLTPLRSLSSKLERFFGSQLDEMMSAPGSGWAELYTVFSGGDDILLVGPWNVVVDFAAYLREAFARYFAGENLTISAGVALVKPKFPIRLAAGQAEEMLEQAKTRAAPGAAAPKDQLVALGGCWKWPDHQRIVGAGKQLAGWVESGAIERGWLHTLMGLTLLQRSVPRPSGKPAPAMNAPAPDPGAGARSEAVVPAMAGSRLAYHVARNWPRHGPARQWIDAIRPCFDRIPDTSDPVMTHLPSVLRYAVLATGSPSDKE
jgi:CRISPR-associated protein Csm1